MLAGTCDVSCTAAVAFKASQVSATPLERVGVGTAKQAIHPMRLSAQQATPPFVNQEMWVG